MCACGEPVVGLTAEEDEDISLPVFAFGERLWAPADTCALSIWVDRRWFEGNGGTVCGTVDRATAVDGSEITVEGEGMIRFELWGEAFEEKVRVMSSLPDKILIGRRFLRRQGFQLDLDTNQASIRVNGRRVQGTIG